MDAEALSPFLSAGYGDRGFWAGYQGGMVGTPRAGGDIVSRNLASAGLVWAGVKFG
jgi:hypothetical protein